MEEKKTEQTKKEIVVVWFYKANYGKNIVYSESCQKAIQDHLFYHRKDIELIAFENEGTSSQKILGMSEETLSRVYG